MPANNQTTFTYHPEGKLTSFFTGKCPRCGQGRIFESRNPYNLTKMQAVNRQCSACHLNFIPELGFYWGATYMAYAITVAFSGFTFGISWVLFGFMRSLSIEYIAINALLLIIFSPIFFRFSRISWLWMFWEE
ncbi:MAG: hypothetical protein QM706_14920 [Nitrospira sp.]